MALNIRDINLNPEPIDAAPQRDAAPQDRQAWWLTLFLLCGILGAMLALSVRTQQMVQHTVAKTSTDILQKQLDDQQRTIKAQQAQIAKYENGASSRSAETQALSADLKSAKLVAGLTAVQGPGVIVTLNDSKKPFNGVLPPGFQPPNIIHDMDINTVVNELKQAGAEAVSVNDQRLIATSAVRCAGPTVYVNNTQAAPPFVIRAIGDPKTLQPALDIPGGEADQVKTFDKDMLKSQTVKHVVIPAYSGVLQPKYAVPVKDTLDKTASADKSAGA